MTTTQRTIGRYRILGEIASGSFGRVYRGEDTTRQNYPVAIKLMHAAHLPSAQERSSFMQEAQLLTLLRHPFIVPVLDIGIENEFPYLVMEYAPNGSLYDRLRQVAPRPLPVKEAQKIIGQVGAALHYAHQQNVIHRDLKPANILFNAQGDALLADFGIATMLATSMKSGTAVGTPYYMAPEQFRGTISKEGDQYALGCIAYQIMTGRLPYDAPDFFSLGYKHMSEKAIPPTQLNLLIPYPVEVAILKAMAKQRTDRFPDVQSFIAALGAPNVGSRFIVEPRFIAPRGWGIAREEETQLIAPAPTTPLPLAAAPHHDEEEGEGNITLKRRLFIEQEVSRAADEQEGQPGRGPNYRVQENFAYPENRAIASEDEGQAPASANPLPFLVDMPTQVGVMPDVLPRVVEGPEIPTPVPGGSMAWSRRYSEEEGVPAGRGAGNIVEEEGTASLAPTILAAPAPGARKRDLEEDLEGEDAAVPGYMAGAQSAVPWGLGVLPVTPQPQPKKRKRRSLVLIAAVAALLLVLLGGGVLYAMTGLMRPAQPKPPALATARVTITPATTALKQTFTIDAVTSKPNAVKNQVQASTISASASSQAQTINATGHGTSPATFAKGTLYIYDVTHTGETIPAGQGFYDASQTHIVYVLSRVTIPSGGSAYATGESNIAGTGGNLPAGYFNYNYCYPNSNCTTEIHLQNTTALAGGQNASTYTDVAQSDINNANTAANQLAATETTAARSEVDGQIHAGEALFGSVSCTSANHVNGYVGERASNFTASASASCSVEVYDQQGALNLAASLLQASVSSTPGEVLAGKIGTTISSVTAGSQGMIILHVTATGTGTYTFSASQKQALARLIAGKTRQEAQDILVNQAGIGKAIVIVSGGDGKTLPKDSSRITIVVTQAMSS